MLIPEIRRRPARAEVAAALKSLAVSERDEVWQVSGPARVTVAVISWDDVFTAMLGAKTEDASGDLKQLWGACRALQGADVAAFTEEQLTGRWIDRIPDLRLVIDWVSREVTAQLSLVPLSLEAQSLRRPRRCYRYLGASGLPNLAVGVRIDRLSPPLWVRWHPGTANVALVETRLKEAGKDVHLHEGGIWVPLDLQPAEGSATRQIASLVSQVVDIYKTAVAETGAVVEREA